MSKNADEYVVELRKGGSGADEVIENIRKDKVDELKSKRAELEIAKLQAEIKQIHKDTGTVDAGMARDYTTRVFEIAKVDPAKAKEFLASLDQESMNKLAYLHALENGRAEAFLKLAQSSGTNVKDLLEVMKFMRGGNGGGGGGMDLKGIAAIFQAGVSAAKTNQPAGGVKETYDYVMGIVKPFQDALSETQNALWGERLKAIEAKIVNPMDQINYVETMAEKMGMTRKQGTIGATELRLEEMREAHDLDVERIRWEQKKFLMTQDAERDKWERIQETFAPILQMASPEIRNAIRKVGQDVGKTIGGAANNAPQKPQAASFTCPKCKEKLNVPIPPNATGEINVKCPKCGEVTPTKLAEPPTEQAPPEEKARGRLSYRST